MRLFYGFEEALVLDSSVANTHVGGGSCVSSSNIGSTELVQYLYLRVFVSPSIFKMGLGKCLQAGNGLRASQHSLQREVKVSHPVPSRVWTNE